MDLDTRSEGTFGRIVEFMRGHGGVAMVALVTAIFMVTSGSMPFIDGADKVDGQLISWDQNVSRGDPNALDDGFEHYIVTFSGLADRALEEQVLEEQVLSGSQASKGPETNTNKATRLVPLQTNAAGEVETHDLLELAKQGKLLQIVSDGTTTYAEIEVSESSKEADLSTTTTVAKKEAEAKAKEDEEGNSGDQILGDQNLVSGDPLVALLKKVTGTKKVTVVMPGVYAVATTAKASSYESLPGVEDVDEDIVLTVSTNDPQYGSQWGLHNTGQPINSKAGTAGADIGIEDAWAVSQGQSQVVAVVDTGIDITHPDLVDSIWKNPGEICGNGKDDEGNGFVDDCNGYDFANNDATVFDPSSDNRHATHIAGIIAANTNNGQGVAGIAPSAKVMSVKTGNSGSFRLSDGARGIAYAAANGATVINCSFGTPAGMPYDAVSTMATAIESARLKGAMVIAAAGNDGRNIDGSPTYPASFPHDNLVSVGSSTNTDIQSSFSNYGTVSVDIHAPGSDILSTLPGGTYGGMSGTSMATPMVAGGAALIRSVMPSLSPTEVRALMMNSSTPLAGLSGRSASGQRFDVGRILNSASVPSSEPVRFSFDGFSGANEQVDKSGSIRATVVANQVPNGANVGMRATLVTSVDGAMYGMVDAPIQLAGGTTRTDDQASVTLSPSGGFSPAQATTTIPLGFTLPAGEYALVAEAYSTVDDQTIGRPWAVFFTVAPKGETAPPPVVAPSPSPGGGGSPAPVPAPAPGPSGGGSPAPAPAPSPAPAPAPGPAPTPSPSGGSPGGGTSPAPTPAPNPYIGGGGGNTPTYPAPSGPNPAPTPPPGPVGSPSPPPSPGGSGASPAPTPAVQLPPLPPPVTNGSVTINSLSPRYGSISGGEVVIISGAGFRPTLYVRFGTRTAQVLAMSTTQIAVVTPSHTAGLSDLTVAVSGSGSVTMPNAYTFFDNTPVVAPTPAPSPAPAPSGGGGGGTGGGSTPAPAPSGGGGSSPAPAPAPAPGPAPAPSPTPGQTPTPPASGGSPQVKLPDILPTRFTFGDAIDGPGKTRLRPVVGFSPLSRNTPSTWPSQVCRMTSCQGIRL